MKISLPLQNQAISVADLEELAKSNPQYTKLFVGITQIDAFIKQVCKDVVCNSVDSSLYSIKTEIGPVAYSLYLYNSERLAIVGTTWPIGTFLQLCQSKTIEADVRVQTTKILERFGDANLKTGANVNWV